jgi:hypothetical protein
MPARPLCLRAWVTGLRSWEGAYCLYSLTRLRAPSLSACGPKAKAEIYIGFVNGLGSISATCMVALRITRHRHERDREKSAKLPLRARVVEDGKSVGKPVSRSVCQPTGSGGARRNHATTRSRPRNDSE